MKYLSWILIGIAIAFLVSCNVEKQTAKKVSWLLAHGKMDDECARLFPVIDSAGKTDTTILYDTVMVDSNIFIRDTLIREGKTIYVEKKCPPHQVITKTEVRDNIIYRRDMAEEQRLKEEIRAKEKVISDKDAMIVEKDKKIDKNNWWKIAFIILCALNVIYVVIKIKAK